MNFLGVGEKASTIAVVGVTLGIGFGAGLLIKEVKTGKLHYKDVFGIIILIGMLHSIIEDTFVVSKSGERKSIDELRCPNEIPRRSLEEHRSRKWATGDHVSDKVDNWRRKSDATETGNIATKKNVDGSVFAESSFGKSRASTESSNKR